MVGAVGTNRGSFNRLVNLDNGRLVNLDNGAGWGSTFTTPKKNTASKVVALLP